MAALKTLAFLSSVTSLSATLKVSRPPSFFVGSMVRAPDISNLRIASARPICAPAPIPSMVPSTNTSIPDERGSGLNRVQECRSLATRLDQILAVASEEIHNELRQRRRRCRRKVRFTVAVGRVVRGVKGFSADRCDDSISNVRLDCRIQNDLDLAKRGRGMLRDHSLALVESDG